MRYLGLVLAGLLFAGCATSGSMLACQAPLISDPAAPTSGMLLYCKQTKGKTALNVIFPNGKIQQLVVEP